jgi:hypothetical protein
MPETDPMIRHRDWSAPLDGDAELWRTGWTVMVPPLYDEDGWLEEVLEAPVRRSS